jgi:tetratricopeptide (TPR) repeat protein
MLQITFRFFLLLPIVCFLASSLLAQRPNNGVHGGGGVIDVQVRYADGRPAPAGIHVRLESAEGGAEADLETKQGGKCQFRQATSGVFIVRIAEADYREVSARVELISDPMAYVILDLVPVKIEKPAAVTVPSPGPPEAVSVKDLAVPEPARQEFTKGQESLDAKSIDESIKHLQKAIKLYPDYPQAYRVLGEAYLQKQDWSQAETALKHSVELEPKLTASYLDLGGLRNQTKNYAGAEEALKKCLELSPNSPAAEYQLAKTYWATGRWQDAAPLAESAVKALPDMASAHVLLANIRLKQRNAAAALHEYQEYLRLEPEGAMAPQVREMVAKLQKALASWQFPVLFRSSPRSA